MRSLISRAIAQLDDRGALRGDDAALDLLVLDALLASLGGLVGVLGREVLRFDRAGPTSRRSSSGAWPGQSLRARAISSSPAW